MTRKVQYILAALLLFAIIGCEQKTLVPFPDNASGYEIPETQTFEYPVADSIIWQELGQDSIPKVAVHPFNLDKLPSQPFIVNTFKPMNEPIQKIPLDWSKLEEYALNLDSVQVESFRVKSFLLPKPDTTKALPPAQFPRSGSGILQLGIEEGLPGNYVEEIISDNDGTIWISSERGLIRFDGESFETYDFLPKLSNSNADFIQDIKVDSDNNLWIISASGDLYMLETDLGIGHRIELNNKIIRMAFDNDGKLWFTALAKGAGVIDVKNHTIQWVFTSVAPDNKDFYLGIFTDTNNNIWIGKGNEICIINASRLTYSMLNKSNKIEVSTGFGFFETKQGDIWINSFAKGAYAVSADKKSIQVLSDKQGFGGSLFTVTEDSAGKLWLFDNDTIFVHDPLKNTLKKIPTGVKIYADRVFGNVLIDRNQNLWITTPLNRTMIIDPLGTLPEHLDMNDGLVSNDIWGITEDKEGLIWIGTYNGVNVFDPMQNKLMLINKDNGLTHNRRTHFNQLANGNLLVSGGRGFSIIDKKANSLTEYNINSFVWNTYQHKDGTFWFGGTDGIYIYDPIRQKLKKISKYKDKSLDRLWTLQVDHNGKIWAATITDLFVIDPEKNTISIFPKENLCCDNFFSIHKSKKEELWIAGDLGVSIINTRQKTITNITANNGLVPESSYSLAELNDNIYLGSKDGIVVINSSGDSTDNQNLHFYNFNKRNGFPFNDYNQTASATTSSHQIWWGVTPQLTVLTQEPIFEHNKPRVSISGIKIMDQEPDCIGSKEQIQVFETIDTLWNETLTDYFVKSTFPSNSGYYTNNKIKWDSLSPIFHLPIGLKLPHDQNSVSFSFTNKDIRGKDKIAYRYILEGADDNWSRITKEPVSKDYYNLKQGNYTFKVATRGFNGEWSDVNSFAFTILPPWYKTWIAFLVYAVLALIILRSYTAFRSRKLIKEKKLLEEKVAHRTQQLSKSLADLKSTQNQLVQSEKMASLGELTAGIAHEIQNPLNFVNNFSEVNAELITELLEERKKQVRDFENEEEILNNIKENEQKINHHGKRAESIVKGMLMHSRGNSGQKELTDINALADEFVRLSYHGLRAKDKSFNADFKLDLEENLPKINVVPQDFGRVILNLINNAFYAVSEKSRSGIQNFSPKIIVTTRKIGQSIEIRVTDNGNGFPVELKEKIFQPFFTTKPAGQGTGLGLSLSYDIIKAHAGEFKVESNEREGTEFIIVLPIKHIL